jgi:alkanesulfonate monooxygenase SsuD/methylene tetrahydromethanopterin reductase-like flavin-dependent oxidoreductase (luciferase family)
MAPLRVSLFYLPSLGTRGEIEAGRAGLRGDLYDRMLADLSDQTKLADELGYYSVGFTEHHFHVEGFEVSNNPVLLDLYVAMQTRRLRVGQLSIVLPAQNPIRVAEDIAMLDHMTGGRVDVGFARGYQRRWVDTMAQQSHGIHGALPHQHDEIDAANRALFEECFEIVTKAWTEDLFDYRGQYWSVPAGPTPWDLEATSLYGGGVQDGVVRQLGVVPKPVQSPYPPIYQPFSSSESTIRWCAAQGVTPILPAVHPELECRLFAVHAEASGRALGEGIGVLRDLVIADTDEEAIELWADSGLFCGSNWFSPFGFDRALPHPDTGQPPDMLGDGLALVGSVDTVTRQLETLMARVPLSILYVWAYISLIPNARLMESIERLFTEVLPRLSDL